MNVAVWDTYVTKNDGSIMHFDIIVPEIIKEATTIFSYGKDYLMQKGLTHQALTSKECRFCHIETLHPTWEESINKNGYYIYEMENCN